MAREILAAQAEQLAYLKRCEVAGRTRFESSLTLKALAVGAEEVGRTWHARLLRFAAERMAP